MVSRSISSTAERVQAPSRSPSLLLDNVHESFPFSIALSWKGSAPDSLTIGSENQQSSVVFPKGNPIPSVKALAFYRSTTFTVDVVYADVGDMQVPAKISTYTISPFRTSKDERAKLKVKVWLNLHGIVSIEPATMLEEEEVEVATSEVAELTKLKFRKRRAGKPLCL
ncbi:heat shock 70 kDa protein 15-like isoform X2 [Musa acuminata AAA Group]|uniref:heat shock 70 kDa protein 15-like isoform X2 n=1 Tax=Musa acuminata AAA Group TaxID=214697 RepID=UPI0031DA257B